MPPHRRRSDVLTAAVALAVLALAVSAAVGGTVGPAEQRVFLWVNGLPDSWYAALWTAQVFGVLGMPLAVAAVAAVLRRWRLVLGLVLLVPLKLLVEREVLKVLVHRDRPGTTIPGAVLRDVPAAGLAFPSGHAIIAFGIVVLLAPYLARPWWWAVVGLATLNAAGRVYLGAHAPLDAVAGAAAGVAVAAMINLAVGVPGPVTVTARR